MKKILLALSAVLLTIGAVAADYDRYYTGLPVEMARPELPRIADREVRLTEFGAAGDGVTLCTAAFEAAIDALSAQGGGRLVVPAGVWLTGPIKLKSGIDLHIERGAVVLFTPDKRAHFSSEDYRDRANSCITAEKCNDISITGEGVIDGNGKYWRYAKREKMSDTEWKDLRKLGGSVSDDGKFWFPDHLKHFKDLTSSSEDEEALRAHMISIKRCKGGSGETGLKNGPCRDILICDNTVFHAHGGFVIGSDFSGGMERIVVRNCTFSGTDTGLRFKSAPDRGGVTKDIYITDISMNDIREAAVTFKCDYSDVTYKDPGAAKDLRFMPDFTDIHISNVVCRECEVGVEASGIPGVNAVHGITLTGCTFFYMDEPTAIDTETADIKLENVRFMTY